MKLKLKLILLLGLVVIVSEFQVIHASEYRIPSVLSCVRSIVNQKSGGIEGIRKSATILKQLTSKQINEADKVCRHSKRKLKKTSISPEEQWLAVRELDLDSVLENIFYQFIHPTTTCIKAGISFAAALGPQFSIKLDGAFCESSDGKRWL